MVSWSCSKPVSQGCCLIWRLNYWRTPYQPHSNGGFQVSVPCWLLGRHFSFSHMGLLKGCLTWPGSLCPQSKWSEWVNSRLKQQCLHKWISIVTYHHFCYILFNRTKSLNPLHTQREGNPSLSFKGRHINAFVGMFLKLPSSYYMLWS